MPVLANVALTDTFDTWRVRTNQLIAYVDEANGAISNVTLAFNRANLAIIQSNNTANSANAYAVIVGISANSWANSLSAIGNNAANSANAYAVTVGAAGNTTAFIFANNRANSANAYAVTVGAASGAASNAYAVTVGAASNTWANTKLDNSTTTFAGSLTITGNLIMFANQTLTLGSGPSTQRPLSPSNGMIRYNTTLNNFEGYKSGVWGTIGGGGATGGSTDDIFYENSQNVTANYSITTNKNAMTAGPVSINSNIIVTINVGSTWVIV